MALARSSARFFVAAFMIDLRMPNETLGSLKMVRRLQRRSRPWSDTRRFSIHRSDLKSYPEMVSGADKGQK